MLGTAPIGSIALGQFSGTMPVIVGSSSVTLGKLTASSTAGSSSSATATPTLAKVIASATGGLTISGDALEHLSSRATTNVLYNNTMAGAVVGVVGSGGSFPTRFTAAGVLSGGITQTIVAIGRKYGMPYIEVLWSGTPVAANSSGMYFDTPALAATAAVGETWVSSCAYEILDITGVLSIGHGVYGRTSAGVGSESTATNISVALAGVTRYEATRTLNTAGTARVTGAFTFSCAAGVPLSFRMRIYPAQVELGSTATNLIYCTAGATSRSAFGIYSTASVTGAISATFNTTAGRAILTSSVLDAVTSTLGAENLVSNSSLSGAVVGVVGSGGSLPTGWAVANTATVEVQAIGVRNGLPYIRVRLQRTATGTEYPGIRIACAGILPNTTYTPSIFLQEISGTGAPLQFNVQYRAAGLVYQGNFVNIPPNGTWRRMYGTGSSVANSAEVYFAVDTAMTTGQSIDKVFELACPQMETGSVLNIPKLTYGTAVAGGQQLGDFAIQNYIPNSTWWSTARGAVPSSIQLNSGTITATGGTVGVDDDGRYIEVWFGGTNTSGVNKFPSVILSTATTTVAFGERWLGQARIKLLGTIPAGVTTRVMLQELLGGSWLADNAKYITPQTVATREFVTSLITQPTANNVFLTIGSVWPNGASGSFGVRIYDPQLEKNRTTPSIYVPTNGAAVTQSRNLGLIGSAQVYDRVCNSIIYTESRGTTNNITNTTSLGSNVSGLSIVYNSGIAPNGRNEAVLLQNTEVVISTHTLVPPGFTNVVPGLNYVASAFVKQSVGRYAQIVMQTAGFGTSQYANFDTQTGTFTVTSGLATWAEDWGNGWWRVGVRGTATATAGSTASWAVIGTSTQGRNAGYLNSTDNLLFWGPKFEQSDTMTAFNPTIGSAAAQPKWGPSISATAQLATSVTTNITLDPIQRTNLVTPFVQGWAGYAAWPVYTDALGPTGKMDAKTFTMQDVVNQGDYQGGLFTTSRKYFGQVTCGLWVKAETPVVIYMGPRDGYAAPQIIGTTWQQITVTNTIPGPDTSGYQNGTRIMQWFVRRVDNSTVPLSTRIWVARPQANFGPTLLPFTEYGVGDVQEAISATVSEHMSLPQKTNYVSDPEFTTANVAGNTLPTGTFQPAGMGISRQLLEVGKLPDGRTYMNIRVFGTSIYGSVWYPDLHFTATGGVPATLGQAFSGQVSAKIISNVDSSGFVSPLRYVAIAEYNGGTYVASVGIGIITTTLQDFSGTRVVQNATTNNGRLYIDFSVKAGGTVDLTFQVAAPQVEIGQPSPYLVGSRTTYGITLTAAVAESITSSVNKTLSAIALTGVASGSISATVNRTLSVLDRTILGGPTISGVVSKTIGSASLSASIGNVVSSTLTKTLDKATSAGLIKEIRRRLIWLTQSKRAGVGPSALDQLTDFL